MRLNILRKQPNSRMCLVCGLKNDLGLKSAFYELENQELLAIFTPDVHHQSYPGRLHGGIASSILDESMGRAIMIGDRGDVWGVTVDLEIRFKMPVPLNRQLRIVSRVVSENKRFFVGSGELLLPDGSVAVAGRGKYLKQPPERIADFDPAAEEWRVVLQANDPEVVDI